ncbi:MAG: hypothetical protein JWP55_218 [Mycobacterium sp.]|nr:hypothetical protein [Mycobacterium sp.]
MSSPAASFAPGVSPVQRLDGLFAKLAELTGQRNAIDGQIVDIVWTSSPRSTTTNRGGATGARSVSALVAWKTGVSPRNADTIVAVAHRLQEFPRCAKGMREGRFSLDQVGAIAEKAADGSVRTTRRWPPAPRSRNCAPRSSRDRDPNPSRGRNRRGRSAIPPTSSPPAGDHPAARRGRDVRRRPAVAPRRPDRPVETRPHRQLIRAGATVAEHRRCVHEPGSAVLR